MWDYHSEENRQTVFAETGCEDEETRLACLRSKSIVEIQNAINPARSKYREWQWGIVVDDDFYTDRCGYNQKTNSLNGDACYNRVAQYNFMSGCCSADGYAFAPSWIKREGQGSKTRAHKAMSDYVQVYGYSEAAFAGLKYAYGQWASPENEAGWRNVTVEAETDWRYCWPTLNMHHQRAKVEGAKNSFLYYFDAPSNLDGGMKGAGHCSDNSYEFGWPVINKWHGPEQEQLSRIMMEYWGNFARDGQPNSDKSHVQWDKFDPDRRNYIRFDLADKTEIRDNFRTYWSAAWQDMMVEIEDSLSD